MCCEGKDVRKDEEDRRWNKVRKGSKFGNKGEGLRLRIVVDEGDEGW